MMNKELYHIEMRKLSIVVVVDAAVEPKSAVDFEIMTLIVPIDFETAEARRM
jgi:hypothetical protein